MRSKKEVKQPNVMIGYDDKGKVSMYYWQKEPFKVRSMGWYGVPRRLWWNPIWRIKQWWMFRKPITFGEFKNITKSL